MTPQERLECPLLRCTQRFPDHEAMLKHLAGCRYLAFGEYWCYDHMRVERFDDLKCRRCLGHPSKRRKILHMAKSFFRSLGHKSKKMQGMSSDDGDIMLPPPPSYDSLNIPSVNGRASELPSTEILEIDSMELPLIQAPPMPAPSDVIDPQALIMTVAPPLPELDSTMLSSDAFMQWQPVSAIESPSFPIMTQDDGSVKVPATKPTLQLTTAGLQGRRQSPRPVARPASVVPRSKGLSPSSSVRSTASTDTNASTTSNGSSLISPASNWSGAWSMGSGLNTGMTSPVDGIVADDMFAEASNSYSHDACPNFLHDLVSELPADLPMLDNASDMPSDALLGFNPSSTANVSYNPDIVLTDDVADEVERDEPEIAETNACCSETKSLVCSAWDALQEHVVSSMVKIQDQQGNRLASQLEAMSIKTVATTGLRVLRALINGHQPSSASDALCLIHLVYAFSLVLHEQGIPERFDGLFLQSLTYMNELPPSDRDLYRQLVMSIWQPPGINQARIDHHLASVSGRPFGLSPDPKGKSPQVLDWGFGQSSDSVLAAARDFLDELEMSLLLSHDSLPLEVQVSDLHITHLKDTKPAGLANGALVATTKYVLEMLAQGFSHPRLNDRLEEIYRRLGSGSICSVRRIEIEILHAGKVLCSSTPACSTGLTSEADMPAGREVLWQFRPPNQKIVRPNLRAT
ncbi:uncharacterized protein THITE_2115907 [Thermothielavioides terrestris NRRL 8126]|uniref:Uncharacterized protein n=1 Tax=Thermothielavioides terrestris (strain ATCC 38088 / NRRL 8126) TaxID=578455 RepID=G2QYW6_THETT|nr:uncharacterized protein THITE_2115907 [Thermothielavioides terrestris NRRL 8126]AEO67105.1 hypothetical protein THITE_2115907 [Thermothielavioides terrestris NRRL 8126]